LVGKMGGGRAGGEMSVSGQAKSYE